MAIGFNQSEEENGDKYTGQTFEDYIHTIKLFGIPVIKITKKHIVDTQSKGKAQS